MGGDYAFSNINTVGKLDFPYDNDFDSSSEMGKNLYGWRKYTFFIATSPLGSKTLSLSLGVGDEYSDDKTSVSNYATGYAFFDMVEGREIDATEFNTRVDHLENLDAETQKYFKVIDLSLKTAFANDSEKEAFAFDYDNWEYIGYTDGANIGVVSGETSEGLPQYGLDDAPQTSVGKFPADSNGEYVAANEYLKNLLIISSYSNTEDDVKNYAEVYRGVKSATRLSVPMFSYRRLSVWVKTDGVSDTSGADIVLKTNKLVKGGKENEYKEFVIENITGDENAVSRHGWKEYAFYIQGSSIEDYDFELMLRLGSSETDKAHGTVLFNNIRFDSLTGAEFSDNSANGTVVSIDETFADNDSGVTNGAFFLAGDYDEYKYPLAPASWTKVTASDAKWDGYSQNDSYCDYDNVISGIVPTEKDFVGDMYKDLIGYGITNPRRGEKGNLLVISSKNPTAIGYRSSDITLTANTANRLTVTLNAKITGGYGANLILKSGSKVISTIENIKTTNGFETFTFYVEGAAADKTVSVELWLGMLDRDKNNNSKLSGGTVFFSQVSFAALADGESYATFKAKYESDVSSGLRIKSAAYTFKAEDFTAYDHYDNKVVKYPYNWKLTAGGNANVDGVVYGIFDSTNIPAGNYEIPETFENSENTANNGVLYLHNVSPTASRLTLDNGFTIAASTYYKLSVTLKVDLGSGNEQTAVGAGVELTSTDFKFENILSTRTVTDQTVDNETFKTFEFYILGGAEEKTVSVAITLGGAEYPNQHCSGRVYVNDVTFTEIDNVQYDDTVKDLSDPDAKTIIVKETEKNKTYAIKADLSTPASSDDATTEPSAKPSFNWWLVPSILFAVALLIAIVGIVVRRISESRSKKHVNVEKVSGYDRKNTLNRFHNENADKDGAVKAQRNDEKSYSEFDDDKLTAESPAEPKTHKAEEVPVSEETQEEVPAAQNNAEQSAEETAENTENAEVGNAEEPATVSEEVPVSEEPVSEEPAKEPVKEPVKEPAKEEKAEIEKETTATVNTDPYVDEFDD